MITFSTVKENILQSGRRILKVLQFQAKTADVISSFGDDSAPLQDMTAIYADTSENSDNIIIGYINTNQIAQPGEKRIFSLQEDGSDSFYIHLKNDETCEVGGNSDNMVRYSELESAFNQLKSDFNSFVLTYNTHTHPGVGATPNTTTQTSADISGAKIDEIKTI